MRAFLTVLLLLVVAVVAAGAVAWHYTQRELDRPLNLDSPQSYVVKPGATLRGISRELAARQWIDNPDVFYWYGRLRGDAPAIQAGEYELGPDLTARSLLALFVSGDVVLHSVTFVEGWTTRMAIETLQRHPAIAVSLDPSDDGALLEALGGDEKPPGRAAFSQYLPIRTQYP